MVLAACSMALATAYFGTSNPVIFAVVPAALVVALIGYAAHRWPERTISATTFLVLVADTKFRFRDSSASLRGEVDGQVLLELALYAVAAMIAVVVTIRKSVRTLPPTGMEMLLFGSVGVALVSAAWSSTPIFTIVRGTQLLIVYTLGRTLLLSLGPERTLRAIGGAVLVYVLVCSTIAVLFPWTVITMEDLAEFNRFSWFGVWPTQAARYVALATILLVTGLLFRGGRERSRRLGLPAWLWIGPLGVLLVLTYSRTALAACALALGALVAVKYFRIWRATALIAVAVAAVLVFVNSAETFAKLLDQGAQSSNPLAGVIFRGQSAAQISSLSGRIGLWEGVWKLFLERPWLGYGYQGSRAFLLAVAPWAGHAHNALAQASLDLGIAGTVPVCIALGSLFSPRFLRRGGPESDVIGWRATIFVLGLFLLTVSASAESFVEPGYEALVFVTCVLGRERIRHGAHARVDEAARRVSSRETQGALVA